MGKRIDTDNFRKRQFLLTLSVNEGQDIAKIMGFQPPSVEVQESEQTDVLRKLVEVGASGIASSLSESTMWMCDLLKIRLDMSEEERNNSYNVFFSHVIASVIKLVDEGLIEPTTPVRAIVLRGDSDE
jgi:hypothetical protein